MTVQTPGGQPEGGMTLVARLRTESAVQSDKSTQALLLHESRGGQPLRRARTGDQLPVAIAVATSIAATSDEKKKRLR